MRNLKAMKGSAISAGQKGFTIIELVVVILLLGILTATALPRFIDVTEEAKDAVRDATAGGLRTGFALYRASVIAGDVQSGAAPLSTGDYTLLSSASGYPLLNGTQTCESVYTGLLQTGYTSTNMPTAVGNTCTYTLIDVSRQILLDVSDGTVSIL